LLPTIRFCTRPKILSQGLGVSAELPLNRSRTAAGSLPAIPYLARMARASAKVERSGTVGPEPITSRSSPITSDKINASTVAG
jgi:hypothetical protein